MRMSSTGMESFNIAYTRTKLTKHQRSIFGYIYMMYTDLTQQEN